jgi:hypothetical protein
MTPNFPRLLATTVAADSGTPAIPAMKAFFCALSIRVPPLSLVPPLPM